MKLLKHLTPEEHERCASRIRRAEDELYQVLVTVQRAYGVSDRAMKPLEKMVITGGLLSILQCRMDDHFYHDGHQGQSPYYGRRLTTGSTVTAAPVDSAVPNVDDGAAAGEP